MKKESPVIQYYISVTDSESFNKLSFHFGGIRAYQIMNEGTVGTRSVYLNEKMVSIKCDGSQEYILLGRSEIESGMLQGFDFYFTELEVETKDGKVYPLEKTYYDPKIINKQIEIEEEERKVIKILIDIDASVKDINTTDSKLDFDLIAELIEE